MRRLTTKALPVRCVAGRVQRKIDPGQFEIDPVQNEIDPGQKNFERVRSEPDPGQWQIDP